MPESVVLLNSQAMQRAITRVAHEIAERNEASSDVVLVGIQRGGVPLATRLGEALNAIWQHPVPVGSLDVSMHRDDLDRRAAPKILPGACRQCGTGANLAKGERPSSADQSGPDVRSALDFPR